ncbi:MAG: hypothetical protein QOH57_3475 [Mycobacterium sp.]|jgi:hypothetical protein|nr:hypothetical protein [Mycobacterium sp.]
MTGPEQARQTSGEPGSRDTGSDQPSGGPVDRPSDSYEGDESVPSYGGQDEGPLGGTGELPPQDTGSAIPPYEGRTTSTHRSGESVVGGVNVGGATGPVEDADYKSPAPGSTSGGTTASPADEQPAAEAPETDLEPDATGPGHVGGTRRAEDEP